MKSSIVPTGVRFDPELKGRLQDYVHKEKRSGRKTSFDAEVQRAVGKHLNEIESGGSSTSGVGVSQDLKEARTEQQSEGDNSARGKWLAMLGRILDSGHRIAIDAVTQNLIAFDLLVRADSGERFAATQVPFPEDFTRALDRLHADEARRRKGGRKTGTGVGEGE